MGFSITRDRGGTGVLVNEALTHAVAGELPMVRVSVAVTQIVYVPLVSASWLLVDRLANSEAPKEKEYSVKVANRSRGEGVAPADRASLAEHVGCAGSHTRHATVTAPT